jgi:hypothetical protein
MPALNHATEQKGNATRDRAFYLLKKYTSISQLRTIIKLYQEFLDDFSKAIKVPPLDEYALDEDLKRFMEYLPPLKEAEQLFSRPVCREEAFRIIHHLPTFPVFSFWDPCFGKYNAHKLGILFNEMGYRPNPPYKPENIFEKAAISSTFISLLCKTVSGHRIMNAIAPGEDHPDVNRPDDSRESHKAREAPCWNDETLFIDPLKSDYRYRTEFPEGNALAPCPAPSSNTDTQKWSGQTLPTTGIWEPWPVDPTHGPRCPNYFLAGSIACQYPFEGSGTLENVRWRLIWKDTRYQSGSNSIPYEEEAYFAYRTDPAEPHTRLAHPGEPCPESGQWYSPQLHRNQNINAGDPMPGPELNHMGSIIWYLFGERRKKH